LCQCPYLSYQTLSKADETPAAASDGPASVNAHAGLKSNNSSAVTATDRLERLLAIDANIIFSSSAIGFYEGRRFKATDAITRWLVFNNHPLTAKTAPNTFI
jgi:hypothetical protein